MAISIFNPGNVHAGALTVGGITNNGGITGAVTMPVTGAGVAGAGSTGSVTLTGAGAGVWTNTTHSPSVNIHHDGIDLQSHADIKIGDQSLKDFMTSVSARLSILVPDPEKLEKFEALRQAYEHYKLMEALCCVEDKPKND